MGKFTLPRGRWFVLGAVAGAALAAGTVAFAAIPDNGGTIHGCYQKNVGNLRVIEPSAGDSCRPSEVEISWSQTGPRGLQGLTGAQGPKGDPGAQGSQGLKGDTGATGAQGSQGLKGDTGPQGQQGPTGPAGPRGIVGPQSCAAGQNMTGIDASGSIVCSGGTVTPPACASRTFYFSIASVAADTLENWPGGTYTQTSGAGCSVTVRAPSGNISVVGGTTGADAWQVVAKTGFLSASGTAYQPSCGGFAAVASVTNNRPSCSNSSIVFESGPSRAEFEVVGN
jgi:hypothetical protein